MTRLEQRGAFAFAVVIIALVIAVWGLFTAAADQFELDEIQRNLIMVQELG
jgi:hypothetical protein